MTQKGATALLNSVNNKTDSAMHVLHIKVIFIKTANPVKIAKKTI